MQEITLCCTVPGITREGGMGTVADITKEGLPPQTHLYNDPDLSPLEFLHAVYRDRTLPMSTRMMQRVGCSHSLSQGPRALPLLNAHTLFPHSLMNHGPRSVRRDLGPPEITVKIIFRLIQPSPTATTPWPLKI